MATREINTALTLSGEKEFNAEMKAVNSNLRTLKSDMALVSAEFEGNSNSVDALTAKQKVLSDIQAQQAAKVEALRQRYEYLKQTEGENAGITDKYKQSLNAAMVAQIKNTRAIEENEKALADLKQAEEEAAKAAEEEAKAAAEGAKFDKEKDKALRAKAKAAEQAAKADWAAERALHKHSLTTEFATNVAKKFASSVKETASDVSYAAHRIPIFGEALDVLSLSMKGVGAAAPIAAKGIGVMTGATVALTTAAAGTGLAAVHLMASYAKEQAAAAKKLEEAHQPLTDAQKQWLEYANQLDTFDKAVSGAKSAIGGILLPVLSDLSTEGAAFLNDFSAAMDAAAGDTAAQGKVMAEYVAKGAQLIKQKLPAYVETGKALLKGLGEGLEASGPELLETGIALIMDLLDGIIAAAPAIGDGAVQLITTLTDTLLERGPDMLTSAVELVTQLVTGLSSNAPKLAESAVLLVAKLVVALAQAAPDLLVAGLELLLGILNGIKSGLGKIYENRDEIISTIKTAFAEKMDDIMSVGKNIVTGIWDGITSATDWLFGKLGEWIGNVYQFIKNKLGIHSPSTVFRDGIGVNMAKGIGIGFQQEMAAVNRQIAASINTAYCLPTLPHSGLGRYYADRSGNVINLYFYAQQITEENMDMVIDMVNRKLGEEIA